MKCTSDCQDMFRSFEITINFLEFQNHSSGYWAGIRQHCEGCGWPSSSPTLGFTWCFYGISFDGLKRVVLSKEYFNCKLSTAKLCHKMSGFFPIQQEPYSKYFCRHDRKNIFVMIASKTSKTPSRPSPNSNCLKVII